MPRHRSRTTVARPAHPRRCHAAPHLRVHVDPARDYADACRQLVDAVVQAAAPGTAARLLYSRAAVQAQRLGHVPNPAHAEAIRVRVLREALGLTGHSAEALTAKRASSERPDAHGTANAPASSLRVPRSPRRPGPDARGAHRLGIGGR